MLPGLISYEPQPDPVERIVAAVLGYAIRDGAREIHLHFMPSKRGVGVFFRGREGRALCEQMKVPIYVWKPLRTRLEQLAGTDGAFQVDLNCEDFPISLLYRIEMSIEGDAESETIVLKLNGEFLSPHSQLNP